MGTGTLIQAYLLPVGLDAELSRLSGGNDCLGRLHRQVDHEDGSQLILLTQTPAIYVQF